MPTTTNNNHNWGHWKWRGPISTDRKDDHHWEKVAHFQSRELQISWKRNKKEWFVLLLLQSSGVHLFLPCAILQSFKSTGRISWDWKRAWSSHSEGWVSSCRGSSKTTQRGRSRESKDCYQSRSSPPSERDPWRCTQRQCERTEYRYGNTLIPPNPPTARDIETDGIFTKNAETGINNIVFDDHGDEDWDRILVLSHPKVNIQSNHKLLLSWLWSMWKACCKRSTSDKSQEFLSFSHVPIRRDLNTTFHFLICYGCWKIRN